MLASIEIGWLVVLVFLTAILVFIANKLRFESYGKVSIYLFLFGFLVYSGVGICVESISKKYLIQYFLFALLYCISFRYAGKLINGVKKKERKQILQPSFYCICAFLFWALLLLKLVYPVNKIPNLLHPSVSLVGVFSDKNTSALVSLIELLMVLLRPGYYVYLHEKASIRRIAVLLTLEVYLTLVINGYIARSGLIAQVIFVALSITSKNTERAISIGNEKKELLNRIKRVLVVLFFVFLISMPVLYEYQFIRLGTSTNASLNLYSKVDRLLKSEFSFPTTYEFCSKMHDSTFFFRYLVYVFTLPIPSQLISIPNRLLLNQEFSIAFSGIAYGAEGFSILLPSLLGEGILMFGTSFAFLFGGVLGLLLGIIFAYYENYKEFRIWVIFLCMLILLMCRGGSQSAIAIFINGSVVVFLTSFLDRYKFTTKKARI